MRRRLRIALLASLASACLVQRPPPSEPPPTSEHETMRTAHPNGETRRETRLLRRSDGHSERDGPEREFHPGGELAAERHFTHDRPSGLWRTWYPDGTPSSEVDFGVPDSHEPRPSRFWHRNGRLAAEGTTVSGVREGAWSFWSESGVLLRRGSYRAGQRDGAWSFFDEAGAPAAQGAYALGARVGEWTLWDEHGEAHVRPAPEVVQPSGSAVPQ